MIKANIKVSWISPLYLLFTFLKISLRFFKSPSNSQLFFSCQYTRSIFSCYICLNIFSTKALEFKKENIPFYLLLFCSFKKKCVIFFFFSPFNFTVYLVFVILSILFFLHIFYFCSAFKVFHLRCSVSKRHCVAKRVVYLPLLPVILYWIEFSCQKYKC